MSVEGWRRKIDGIDRKLVTLLNQRCKCVAEIGRIKKTDGAPLHQPDREREVLSGVERANRGPLSGEAVRRLFERILEEARQVEHAVMHDESGNAGPQSRASGGSRKARPVRLGTKRRKRGTGKNA
jgi:chorismate mutase